MILPYFQKTVFLGAQLIFLLVNVCSILINTAHVLKLFKVLLFCFVMRSLYHLICYH